MTAPARIASISLQREDGKVLSKTVSDAAGKFRILAVEAGEYVVKAETDGYYTEVFSFLLRPRQAISFDIELQKKEALRQKVQVSVNYLTVDPDKTNNSYTFTRQDLERLPDPLVESANDLANNFMPGASDGHDNFLAVRGTEFSLNEFINGVSFPDNMQPQVSPGFSPQIFETVDLITGGFTSEYGNRFGGVLDITTPSCRDFDGHRNAWILSSRSPMLATASTDRQRERRNPDSVCFFTRGRRQP